MDNDWLRHLGRIVLSWLGGWCRYVPKLVVVELIGLDQSGTGRAPFYLYHSARELESCVDLPLASESSLQNCTLQHILTDSSQIRDTVC